MDSGLSNQIDNLANSGSRNGLSNILNMSSGYPNGYVPAYAGEAGYFSNAIAADNIFGKVNIPEGALAGFVVDAHTVSGIPRMYYGTYADLESSSQHIDITRFFGNSGGASAGGEPPRNGRRRESGSKTIDDIIDNLPETTNGKGVARNFESTGGFNQTIKDFDSLNPIDVKEIQTQYGPGKVGKLSDGTTVVARPGSTTGRATLEIRVSNSKVYKIGY